MLVHPCTKRELPKTAFFSSPLNCNETKFILKPRKIMPMDIKGTDHDLFMYEYAYETDENKCIFKKIRLVTLLQ